MFKRMGFPRKDEIVNNRPSEVWRLKSGAANPTLGCGSSPAELIPEGTLLYHIHPADAVSRPIEKIIQVLIENFM